MPTAAVIMGCRETKSHEACSKQGEIDFSVRTGLHYESHNHTFSTFSWCDATWLLFINQQQPKKEAAYTEVCLWLRSENRLGCTYGFTPADSYFKTENKWIHKTLIFHHRHISLAAQRASWEMLRWKHRSLNVLWGLWQHVGDMQTPWRRPLHHGLVCCVDL